MEQLGLVSFRLHITAVEKKSFFIMHIRKWTETKWRFYNCLFLCVFVVFHAMIKSSSHSLFVAIQDNCSVIKNSIYCRIIAVQLHNCTHLITQLFSSLSLFLSHSFVIFFFSWLNCRPLSIWKKNILFFSIKAQNFDTQKRVLNI